MLNTYDVRFSVVFRSIFIALKGAENFVRLIEMFPYAKETVSYRDWELGLHFSVIMMNDNDDDELKFSCIHVVISLDHYD